jgi:hypothetical protein
MANTYVKIATVSVGAGGQAAIDFTAITGSYTDLCLKYALRASTSSNNKDCYITLNGSTSGFSGIYLQGNGATSAGSFTLARYVGNVPDSTATASTFSNSEIYIPNYSGSTNKSFSIDTVQENNTTTAGQALDQLIAGLWSNTAAITSISITPSSGTFVQYSTATLYGIKNS